MKTETYMTSKYGGNRVRFIFTSGVILLVCILMNHGLMAAQVKVTLKNGQIQVVDILSANQNGIMWKGGKVIAPTLLKHDQIAFIDFAEPRGWQGALEAFHKQEYDEAIGYFMEIANNGSSHYYPAPGNFSSQAMLHLIDCYIETGKFAEVSKIAPNVVISGLPIELRYRAPIIASWAVLGKGDFEKSFELADAITSNGTTSGKAEIAFIKGYTLEKQGKLKEAIQTYGGAYSLDFGAGTVLSRKAMENSIRLLEKLDDEIRMPELHALVHTYARSFSDGGLYPDASSRVHELLAEELGSTKARKEQKKMTQTKVEEKVIEPKFEPTSTPDSIIELNFAEKTITQAGEERPMQIGGIHSLEKIKQGMKGNFTRFTLGDGVDIAISGIGIGASMGSRRLVLEPNKGLGVMRVGADDPEGEGIRMWVAGFEGPGLRVVSVTFGAGEADYVLGNDDEVSIEVQGLKAGQSEYITSFTSEGEDEDFRTMKLNGGFFHAGLYANQKGGKFALTQAQGRYFISSISVELEPTNSSSEVNESE